MVATEALSDQAGGIETTRRLLATRHQYFAGVKAA